MRSDTIEYSRRDFGHKGEVERLSVFRVAAASEEIPVDLRGARLNGRFVYEAPMPFSDFAVDLLPQVLPFI